MRAVIDTNVLVSGLLWHGIPHRLIEQIRAGTLTLIASSALLAELDEVIRRPCQPRSAAIHMMMPCSRSPWRRRPMSSCPGMKTF